MHIKQNLIYITCFLFFLILVIYSNLSIEAAKEGIDLWINIVFPSLFPFFIASSILVSCGAASALGKIIAPIMKVLFNASGESGYIMATSMLSGYPMGPKLCSQMYNKGYISTLQVRQFLTFVNTSGPSFIIGAVACGMLKNIQLGFYLAASHYIGVIITGMLFTKNRKFKSDNKNIHKLIENDQSFGTMISEAVSNAMQTQLMIGGFIILFSVVIKLLYHLNVLQCIAYVIVYITGYDNQSLISAALAGLIEITNSCKFLCENSASLNIILPMICAVISFSGLSIIMQSYTLVSSCGIKLKSIVYPKIIHSIVSFFICLITLQLFPIDISVSNINIAYNPNFFDIFINATEYSLMYVLFIFILLIIFKIIKYRKKPA